METVGVKELRDHLGRILREVERGRVIRVLRHGKEVVQLRPMETSSAREVLERLRPIFYSCRNKVMRKQGVA